MSPLELFRRNQKVMMTFLILLAMFAFVVLPTVSEYMRRSGPGMTDPVVAEFNGVPLTASRVSRFTQTHYLTVQYLRKLAEETYRRDGNPAVPGFVGNPQTGQIQAVGINGTPNEQLSVRILQFASEAEKQGFELDDTAISMWLESYTDKTMSEREMLTLLRRETNNRMGQMQLYDMLRKQLLSALCFREAGSAVAAGQFPLQSPLDHWNNFLRLNQQATVDAYGVLVSDYVEKTEDNYSESEIEAVYQDGKDRYPSEQSPEPGFRKRQTATFEYLLADLQKFRDAEVAKLPEEEIRAEYERQLAGGGFQLPAEVVIEEEVVSDEMSEDAGGDGESSEEGASEPEMPADEDGETPEAASDDSETANKKQVKEFQAELEEASQLPGDSDSADAEPAEEDQSSNGPDENGVRLVVAQDQSGDNETSEESDAASDGATDGGDTAEAGEEADGGDGEPAEADADESTSEEKPKVRPFEEVREQVAQTMVEIKARNALDDAVTRARKIMKNYGRARSLYQSKEDPEGPPPERPNLKSLADELGLSYAKIGPFDPVTIAQEPIAQSFEEGESLARRGVPFTAKMFGVEGQEQIVEQGIFRPLVSVDIPSQRTFLSWKTEQTEAYSPELEEVRQEVIDAIRFSKARELARTAAEGLAAKANEGDSLESLVAENRKESYKTEVGPFSWLTQFGFGSVTITEVNELDSVGDDFMKAVFTAEPDEFVVAANDPKRVYYVVQRTTLQPMVVDLRSIFTQQRERMMAMFMSDGSGGKVQQGFFEAVDEKTGFVEEETP